MIKVLLVYEDFNELTITESYLKKIGFDVTGISNEILIHDQLLSFNPDVLVAFGKNVKVSSFSVGQKMKEYNRFSGKVVIVVPKEIRPAPHEILKMKMDAIIEAPVVPEKLIQVLCRLCNLSADAYLDKFQKARLSDPELARLVMVTGSGEIQSRAPAGGHTPISFSDPTRAEKYRKITSLAEPMDLKQTTHTRAELKQRQKDLKKDWNFDKLEELDELKRQFAEALFKKPNT